MDYLSAATRAVLEGDSGASAISARGLDVVVIGGGDTGNDCVGTAVRQGARSVRQLEFLPEPPEQPLPQNGWPQWPHVKKTDYGQQEAIALSGGEMRSWAVDTLEVLRDEQGAARGLLVADLDWSDGSPRRVEGSEHEIPAQLVLIACGFTGPEPEVSAPLARTCPKPRAADPFRSCANRRATAARLATTRKRGTMRPLARSLPAGTPATARPLW